MLEDKKNIFIKNSRLRCPQSLDFSRFKKAVLLFLSIAQMIRFFKSRKADFHNARYNTEYTDPIGF